MSNNKKFKNQSQTISLFYFKKKMSENKPSQIDHVEELIDYV